MRPLKKVFFLLLLPLLFIGCGPSNDAGSDGKLKILSTTAQIADLVQKVGGDRIHSQVLIRGDLDPHSYEIVKGDGEKLKNSDLIFYNGLGLEHGASLSSFLHSNDKAIAIGDQIQAKHPTRILKKGQVTDPHIWMDISLWQEGIGPILDALCKADPEGKAEYQKRAEAARLEMGKAHQELFQALQSVPSEKRYLITSHDAFRYFTRSYLAEPGEVQWMDRFAAPEGLAPEGQLNPRDLQAIIDFLREKKVEVLFPESNVSRDSIRKIASAGKELGLEIRVCKEPLYGDAMGKGTYLEMMQHNGKTIEKHLCNTQ